MYGVVAGYIRAALITYQFRIGGEYMKRKGKEKFKLFGMLFAFCVFILSPLYKFFNKKSIVQDFLMYNEFDTTITKESDPVR